MQDLGTTGIQYSYNTTRCFITPVRVFRFVKNCRTIYMYILLLYYFYIVSHEYCYYYYYYYELYFQVGHIIPSWQSCVQVFYYFYIGTFHFFFFYYQVIIPSPPGSMNSNDYYQFYFLFFFFYSYVVYIIGNNIIIVFDQILVFYFVFAISHCVVFKEDYHPRKTASYVYIIYHIRYTLVIALTTENRN